VVVIPDEIVGQVVERLVVIFSFRVGPSSTDSGGRITQDLAAASFIARGLHSALGSGIKPAV